MWRQTQKPGSSSSGLLSRRLLHHVPTQRRAEGMPPNQPGPRLGHKLPCMAAKASAKTLIERTTRSEGVRRQVTSRQSHMGGQLRKPGW